MRGLSDAVGAAGLSIYAVIALVLFFGAFIAIVISLFLKTNRATFERARQLPLDDDAQDDAAGAKR